MGEDLERLKQRIPLLEYLQRHHWKGHRVGASPEFAGLCPLHEDTHPSFYVNAQKNLFYCHGCGCGGDLIRFVELSHHFSFSESVAYLAEELAPAAQLLARAAGFYQPELHRHREGMDYLAQRGMIRSLSRNSASAMPAAAICALTCRASATHWSGCLKRA